MAGYDDIYDDVYEPDSGGIQVLDGALFLSTPLFPVGSLAGGDLTLSGVLFESAPLFPTGTLIYDQTLEGLLFESAPLFFTGLLRGTTVARPFTVTVTFADRRLTISGVQSVMTVGETSVPQAYFTDRNGDPYDPDSVTLRLRDPSGDETFPTPNQISTGTFQFPFIGTEEGVWRGRITGTGPGAEIVIETFSVCFVEDEAL